MKFDIQADVDLGAANTLGLPCRAECLVDAHHQDQVRALADSGLWQGGLTLVSGGSNLILPPCLGGITLRPRLTHWWLERHGEDALVHVGAGVNWHQLVMALAERGWWGIENLALIPGQCGAAPVQNIGAYGVELADVLESLTLVQLDGGEIRYLTADDCRFGYRESIFKGELDGRVVITELVLRVTRRPGPRLGYGDLAQRVSACPSPLEVARAVVAIRQEKLPDPAHLGNAGSFFKNPVVDAEVAEKLQIQHPGMPHFPLADGRTKLAAGWLIDQCGLKGWRRKHFAVHERQALVLVHLGGGSAEELLDFAAEVARRVEHRFGVRLEREPRVAGEFQASAAPLQ